ncbi:XdhC family protein [Deferrisoma palaeochoriense]
MENLFSRIAARLGRGERVAVATIARRRGSAPRSRGTRCAVFSDGTLEGTIGGGVLEARVKEEATGALNDGRARVLPFRLDPKTLAEEGMVCGGTVDVLVVPWGPGQAEAAAQAAEVLASGERAALVTRWDPDGTPREIAVVRAGTPAAEEEPARTVLATGESTFRVEASGAGVLAEPLERERAPLVVLGAGHVGRAIAWVADLADFAVTVVDDRPEFADPARFPEGVRVECGPIPEVFQRLGVDWETFVVACTRGHLLDAECAEAALRSPARYVGVIGSRRKREATLRRFREAGVPEERLGVLRMPVGLEIEAETPGEIAVSVVAEMIRERRAR